MVVKRVSFRENFLSAQGWALLLAGLSTTVDDVDFTACGLNEEKAKVIRDAIVRFTAVPLPY